MHNEAGGGRSWTQAPELRNKRQKGKCCPDKSTCRGEKPHNRPSNKTGRDESTYRWCGNSWRVAQWHREKSKAVRLIQQPLIPGSYGDNTEALTPGKRSTSGGVGEVRFNAQCHRFSTNWRRCVPVKPTSPTWLQSCPLPPFHLPQWTAGQGQVRSDKRHPHSHLYSIKNLLARVGEGFIH